MSNAKEWRRQVRKWEADGWTVETRDSGHLKLTHPKARMPVFCASTPSDWRATRNAETIIRRAMRP